MKQTVASYTEQGVAVVSVADVPKLAQQAGLSADESTKLATIYSTSQLDALRFSFAALAIVSTGALFFSRNLPAQVLGRTPEEEAARQKGRKWKPSRTSPTTE